MVNDPNEREGVNFFGNYPDIVSMTAGADLETACIRIEYVERIVRRVPNPPFFHVALYVDEDVDSLTGDKLRSDSLWSQALPCSLTWERGFDAVFRFNANAMRGDLMEKIPLVTMPDSPGLGPTPPAATPQPAQAFAWVGGGVITLIVPLSSIGGDGEFAFFTALAGYGGEDCAPRDPSGMAMD